jgi:hypothetical protein
VTEAASETIATIKAAKPRSPRNVLTTLVE